LRAVIGDTFFTPNNVKRSGPFAYQAAVLIDRLTFGLGR